jgi:hypothetical protein
MHLEVRDKHRERRIQGSIGDDIGEMFTSLHGTSGGMGSPSNVVGDVGVPWNVKSHTIDFAFSTAELHGTIGSRRFDLHTGGDNDLVGTVILGGKSLPFVLRGVSELWSMPASDQAAILPMILTCEDAIGESTGIMDLTLQPILSVNFERSHVVR